MKKPFYIGEWKIEPELNILTSGNKSHKLEPKIMQVLLVLADKKGEVVKKDELLDIVWANTVVVDMVLIRAISELRSIFKDKRTAPKYIQTVSKSGYRLIAPVSLKKNKNIFWNTYSKIAVGLIFSIISFSALFFSFNAENATPEMGLLNIRIPKNLTTEKGWEYHPAFSPDGNKIAYVKQNNTPYTAIEILSISDNKRVKITPSNGLYFRPVWLSGLGKIACYTRDKNQVFISELSENDEPKTLFKVKASYTGLAWSEQRNELAYLEKDKLGKHAIFLYSYKDKISRQFTFPKNNIWGDSEPSYAPDGKQLAFIRSVSEGNQDIFLINLDDKIVKKASFLTSNIFGLDWINNNSIIFSSNRNGIDELWELKIQENGKTRTRPFGWGLNVQNPRVHKSKIIGEKWLADTDIIGITHSQNQKWTKNNIDGLSSSMWDLHPSISKNGDIAFASNRSGSFEIWLKKKGSQPQKLTSYSKGFNGKPKWSPNGKSLVICSNVSGKSEIHHLNIADTKLKPIIKNEFQNINPIWSLDGKVIYFSSNKDGIWNLYQYSLETETIVQLTKNGGYFGQEFSTAGEFYYTKPNISGIWKINVKDYTIAEELVISNLLSSDWGNWCFFRNGVIYPQKNKSKYELVYFNFLNKETEIVYTLNKPLPANDPSLTISDDGKTILFGQTNNYNGDIVIYE